MQKKRNSFIFPNGFGQLFESESFVEKRDVSFFGSGMVYLDQQDLNDEKRLKEELKNFDIDAFVQKYTNSNMLLRKVSDDNKNLSEDERQIFIQIRNDSKPIDVLKWFIETMKELVPPFNEGMGIFATDLLKCKNIIENADNIFASLEKKGLIEISTK